MRTPPNLLMKSYRILRGSEGFTMSQCSSLRRTKLNHPDEVGGFSRTEADDIRQGGFPTSIIAIYTYNKR
jgi:hypothetical protein